MAFFFRLSPMVMATTAALTASSVGWAQTESARLHDVTVAGKAAPWLDVEAADVTGWGVPLAKSPQSVSVLSADLIAASAAQTLSSVVRLDASLSDSYNTTGYIESLVVRGFLLHQSDNFSRNGLATSNYSLLALENKERVEVLKGVAGLQAGVSAPGGLVNYVTKQPVKQAFTMTTLGLNDEGGAKVQLDLNRQLGDFGVRLNWVDETLRPQFDQANGGRQLFSLAMATDLTPDTRLTADFEVHHKRQPSVPGLGLLDRNGDGVGDTLPEHINPRLNLNNQAWSQPFESNSSTVEVALSHRVNADWSARLAANTQRTRINDRLAFPDGCSSAPTYVYPGLCGNGDVDIYDYRSEGEQRDVSSWDARLEGHVKGWGMPHLVRLGLTGRKESADLAPMQAYNWVGITNIDHPVELPSDASLTSLNTNSRQSQQAMYATLVSDIRPNLQSFVGSRVTRLSRSSERSDGTRAVSLDQSVTTPWLGLAWTAATGTLIYASYGQGTELEVVPNRPDKFANYGQVLSALTSHQTEIGLKWQAGPRLLVTAAAFDIRKPMADPVSATTGLPNLVAGAKSAQHRGLELTAAGRLDPSLSVQTSLMLLDAMYTQAADASLIGQQVTNVPRLKASVFADYKMTAVPGLAVNALATFESGKPVTADGSLELPSAWQLDAGISYSQKLSGRTVLWRLNAENLTNRVYWREAPSTEWGGIYLFPSTPRTLRASVSVDF